MKKVRNLFAVLAVVVVAVVLCAVFVPNVVQAATVVENGSCGTNVKWSLDSDGLLTISGTGSMTNYTGASAVPWYSYRNSVKKVAVKIGVESVGTYAFSVCKSMTTCTIADSVSTVATRAFSECTSLKSLYIGSGIHVVGSYSFYKCTALETVEIFGDTLSTGATIGDYAFYGCTGMTGLSLGFGVVEIGNHSFDGCTSLD